MPLRMDSAVRGPTPDILISSRNAWRSGAVAKPYSSCASSRTMNWVSRLTFSPTAGRL
ncbi:hypothetical protein D3C80_2214040 [compost metagenome]